MSNDELTPDFADCAAGLSAALKRISDGFTSLGDDHFQDVAKEALKQWGYFPPKAPPLDWLGREAKLRLDFADAMGKIMLLQTNISAESAAEAKRYRKRALAAEQRAQELLRVVQANKAKTPA